jgi:GNAT superfamily N-acetyltransferase
MPRDELLGAVSSAYAWHRAFGNASFDTTLARFVVNESHPRVWSANHVSRVAASAQAEIEAVMAEMERRFAHCRHRTVVTDCFTPPSFLARLALDDYREQTPLLQMVLSDALARITPTAIVLRAVAADPDWDDLERLAKVDFQEGLRSGRNELPDDVVRGIVGGYRRKSRVAQFFIAETGGAPCAYGSAVECPGNLGMLEDFFTLPQYRGRGIATTLISHCVDHLRGRGARSIFIGAHVTERAKHLYAKLGFVPLMVSREWVKG